MSLVECLAWAGGTWMAIAIAAAWAKHRAQQRNRNARVKQQRAQRIAEIEARANICHIDDTELADQLALWTDQFNETKPREEET